MEQLTKNQAVATSQEAVQNQNEPQLRDESAHNDKSVHGVLNPTYQAGLRSDAVQPVIVSERENSGDLHSFPTRRSSDLCPRRTRPRARSRRSASRPRCGSRSEEHTSELQSRFEIVCRLLLEKKKV